MGNTGSNNWFKRNPVGAWLLLACISVITFVSFLFILEQIAQLDLLKDTQTMNKNLRVVRLREYRANENKMHLGIDPISQKLVAGINPLRVDSDGFIMPGPLHVDPQLKVFFIGGSTTACTWVDEEKRFPYAVGRLLEEKLGIKVNTYNGGVDGSHSLHSLNVLTNKVISYKPEIVVLKHNINDLVSLLYSGTYWNDAITRSLVQGKNNSEADILRSQLLKSANGLFPFMFPALYEKSHYLYMRLTNQEFPKIDEWKGYRGVIVRRVKEDLLEEFSSSLSSFVAMCRAWGIQPVLMTQAANWESIDENYILPEILELTIENDMPSDKIIPYLHIEFNQIIRVVAKKAGVLLIDLEKTVPKGNELFFDEVHYNNEGSMYLADHISEQLEQLIRNDSILLTELSTGR